METTEKRFLKDLFISSDYIKFMADVDLKPLSDHHMWSLEKIISLCHLQMGDNLFFFTWIVLNKFNHIFVD